MFKGYGKVSRFLVLSQPNKTKTLHLRQKCHFCNLMAVARERFVKFDHDSRGGRQSEPVQERSGFGPIWTVIAYVSRFRLKRKHVDNPRGEGLRATWYGIDNV